MDQAQVENKVEVKNEPEEKQVISSAPVSNDVTEAAKEENPRNSAQWDAFRKARAEERKRAEEIAKKAADKEAEVLALKAAMDALLNKPQQQHQRHNDYEEVEETDEQRIDKRVAAVLAQKEAEYERKRAEKEQAEFPQKLQSTFQDFNQVVNTENLDYLEYHYPEVAQAFKYAPDGFEKWSSIYKAVKRFVPNTDTRKDNAKAEKNLAKPQSMSNPQINHGREAMPATRLSEAQKAANYARMKKALNGLS